MSLHLELASQPLKDGEPVALCVFKGERISFSALATFGDEIEFGGEESETELISVASNGRLQRVLLIGLGRREEFDAHVLRRAVAAGVRCASANRLDALRVIVPEAGRDLSALVQAATEGAVLGQYENDVHRQKAEKKGRLERVVVVAPFADEMLERAVVRGRIVAEATNWARSLADEPSNLLPPRELAQRAAQMCVERGLAIEILTGAEIEAHGMGGLWAVGKGSAEPPALIVVRYEPTATADELWAFVGKGMTFDTGGISIKPWQGMEEMKADMAGGAAVLGAMRAIAELGSPRRLIGIVPAAENMPSGSALKPGDVIKTLAGFTIEAVDTDAEGRLILSDAIAYARQCGAQRIVDLATLTGSIIVALGDVHAGLFSNDDAWAAQVCRAAERAGESVWRMPVSDDYKKLIESDIADFKNYGGRPDATAAALLLSKFAADVPWAHLDIAGTAWLDEERPDSPKGATGAGVRTLIELACGS
ncbi:MAG: leucyl aminopeptidase [Pyrinomonas sp.]|uniref:leucyl aminopeptidase n=1 Tax=Pyrinomonas sp. TaxID=2080306 RepID=UPI003328FBF6